MTDTFMISQLGSKAIASVGAMGAVIEFMYLVLQSINICYSQKILNFIFKFHF
jgi:Na+-driven multidrug efflux pump